MQFTNLDISDTFIVDGVIYTMQLTGFAVDGISTTEFSTVEGQSNVAQLQAVFSTTVTVPEPNSIALFSLSLVALGFAGKHKKA